MNTLESKEDLNLGGIYQIRNIQNNKVYVGSTKCFRKRLATHNYELKHNNHNSIKLQRSYNKNGDSNFIFEIIETVEDLSLNNLLEREQFYVNSKDSFKNGYNVLGVITPSPVLYGYDNSRSKEVICINTMERFGSVAEAGRNKNISYSTIASCCRHNSDITKGLIWFYTEEWDSLSQKDKDFYIEKSKDYSYNKQKYIKRDKSYYVRPILCIETNNIFKSAIEASKFINQKSGAHILECCRGKRKTCGNYHWEYAD